MRILAERLNHRLVSSLSQPPFPFGPFNSNAQRRWKKPSTTAQTRLEDRTRDPTLDALAARLSRLGLVLSLHRLISDRKRGRFVSLQLMSRWTNLVGLNVGMGVFLRKYPHVFEVFTHPARRNLCCRVTDKFRALISEEDSVIRVSESQNVSRLKKLLMMSVNGKLHIHAVRFDQEGIGFARGFSGIDSSKILGRIRVSRFGNRGFG